MDFDCHKCGGEKTVWILPISGGRGTGEATAYEARCETCMVVHATELPSNNDGRKSSAKREFQRIQHAAMRDQRTVEG